MTDLSPLGEAVTVEKVSSLMTARSPELLAPNGDSGATSPLFVESVWGVCAEVQPYVGSAKPNDAATSARWDLAVWAVTLGVAAQLEASLFPEQQGLGDQGRAAILERRYRSALEQLGARLPGDAASDGDAGRPPAPRGRFDLQPAYPDPAPDPYAQPVYRPRWTS